MNGLRCASFLFLTAVASLVHSSVYAQAQQPPLLPTIIECSGHSETVSNEQMTVATFHDDVVVTGNNIALRCDFLQVVVATRKDAPEALINAYGQFRSLVAKGNVHILQGDREATCGRAEVFPGEDRIVLSESPVVRSLDGEYSASGPRLILYRGQRRAVIEGTPSDRARITLPPIKDLGFDDETAENPTQANG